MTWKKRQQRQVRGHGHLTASHHQRLLNFHLPFYRYKEMSSLKIDSLQKSLAESVAASSLDEANKEFADLTAKYRDVLQREQVLT